MSLKATVIEWVKKQNLLHQKIVHTALKNGVDHEANIEAIVGFIKSEVGLKEKNKDVIVDFADVELNDKNKGKQIRLKKMFSLNNVNTLENNMEVPIWHEGLTVIYGENGAGKSGVAKVLKSACSARAPEQVIVDIYSTTQLSIPSAKIEYFLDSDVATLDWKADKAIQSELANIHVFDSKSASFQMDNVKNELSFVPQGGEVFSNSIKLIKEIKDKLEQELESYVVPELSTLKLISGIKDDTILLYSNVKKITDSKVIEEKLIWTDGNEESLEEFEKLLKSADVEKNQKAKSGIMANEVTMRELASFVKTLNDIFTEARIVNIKTIIQDFKTKEKVLAQLGKDIESLSALGGVGEDFWREMYESAKKYSEKIAYSGKKFPVLEEDSKCVLCNQDINEDTKKRFKAFEDIMSGEIKKDYDVIKLKIEEILTFLQKKIDSKESIVAKIGFLGDLLQDTEKEKLEAYVQESIDYANELKKMIFNGENVIDKFNPNIDETFFASVSAKLTLRGKELSDVLEPKKIKDLNENINKLKFKKELFQHKDLLMKIAKINDKNEKILKGVALLNPAIISRASNLIISSLIKQDFLDQFKIEAKALGAQHIPVSMNTSGGDGKVYFEIFLENGTLPRRIKISDVLSEGELKVISLAAFLAEISISKAKHTIIFDDPVTSLDHKFKERISKRLAKEALTRQIIIFTHDISFLASLNDYGVEFEAKGGTLYIHRPSKLGRLTTEASWDTMGMAGMLHYLEQKVLSLSKLEQTESNTYNEKAGEIYGLLRESWEKVVEEVLLNKTISRFSYGVRTQSLAGVSVDEKEYKEVFLAMKKCSRWMIGHKDSAKIDSDRPSIADISEDIKCLKDFWQKKKKLNIALESERKKLVEELGASPRG